MTQRFQKTMVEKKETLVKRPQIKMNMIKA